MENEIKGRIVFPNGFDEKHVSGAFGGFTPSGDFVINFFSEYPCLPNKYSFIVDENGNTKDLVFSYDVEPKLERKIVSSVVMNKESLKSLINWLDEFKEDGN